MSRDDVYSTYEAKARFSEVLKRVRDGRVVTVTWHGRPIAEIRPIDREGGTAARLEWLRSRGVIGAGPRQASAAASGEAPDADALRPLARRPGALERFLAKRDE